MKRIFPVVIVAMFGAWTAAAQTSGSVQAGASAQSQASLQTEKSSAPVSGGGSASSSADVANASSKSAVASGTKVDATLANSLDAKNAKPGDRVQARTTEDVKQDGKVVLQKGTRLEGHVTQAQAKAKGQSQSQLGIVFDHAVLRDGQEIPFNATIQALAVARSSTAGAAGADDMVSSGSAIAPVLGTARGGAGLVGGVASTAGATAGSVVNTASSAPINTGGTLNAAIRSTGAVGGLSSTGRLTSSSSGVFGLQGLSLDSTASSATQGSLIISTAKNVRLDSGTQMLLSAGERAQ